MRRETPSKGGTICKMLSGTMVFYSRFWYEATVKYHHDGNKLPILAQIRSGILPLRIETGLWKNDSIEDRVCLVCDENIVEDEYHFLYVKCMTMLDKFYTTRFPVNTRIFVH